MIYKNKPLFFVILTLFFWCLFNFTTDFSLSSLQGRLVDIRSYVDQTTLFSSVIFFVVYIFIVALSVPGCATIMTLTAGAIFDFFLALTLVSFASAIGATAAFKISRVLLQEWVQDRFSQQLKSINYEWVRNGTSYLLFLRLVPIFPFFVINLVVGILPISAARFYLLSQIGMLPAVAIFVNAGARFSDLRQTSDVMTVEFILSLMLLAALIIVPQIFFQSKKND